MFNLWVLMSDGYSTDFLCLTVQEVTSLLVRYQPDDFEVTELRAN